MPIAALQTHPDGSQSVLFDCPGCGMLHAPSVKSETRPRWEWNGSLEAPTFSPSILVTWTHGENYEARRCHSYVRDGRIEFLSDCTHALAGQTVPLPEIDL
jgi:hypothetical protein